MSTVLILCVIIMECTSTRQMVQHRGGEPLQIKV